MSEHRLTEFLTREDLRSGTGTTPWRRWRCSCGVMGAGYRWSSDLDLANEWGEHVAREQVAALTADLATAERAIEQACQERNAAEVQVAALTAEVEHLRSSAPVSADREAGEYDYRQMWLEASEEVEHLRDAVAAAARLCEEGLRDHEREFVWCDCEDENDRCDDARRYSAIRAALPALPPQEEQR